jgi:hypothetical protein
VRHSQSLRDLLIGQAIRGKRQDLRLARRQPARAEIGHAVPASTVSVSETPHLFSPIVSKISPGNA